ncbi:MAG: FG-GAP-like repeat-containing protein [Saprospiraceae bacterium]|nr:FG-GAP-like repeat-containing protein [Saprospiraceae bacterium]
MDRLVSIAYLLSILSIVHAQEGNHFTEVSQSAGINHAFRVGQATFGGGVAVLDFNNDGYEDLYITGGDDSDVLYRNNQDGTFSNELDAAGFVSTKSVHTQGVASADVNRDGWRDLLVTTLHEEDRSSLASNLLFINNGDGTFRDVTAEWGLESYKTNSQAPSFGDINADGFPDLFIANYFSSSPEGIGIYNEATITSSFTSAIDYLFINNQGRGFVEASEIYKMTHDGFGFEGHFSDFDNDRDVDILIANDFGFKNSPNILLRNDYPIRSLTDRSLNMAFNFGMNAMGIASCDYNQDGWMDYFISNISASLFIVNQQNSKPFINMAPELGLAVPVIVRPDFASPPVSWGANFFDFDHDTDEDLFVCNGALNPTVRQNHNFFFEHLGEVFQEVSQRMGMDDERIARGSAVFDYDLDGDLDLFVVNQNPRDPTDALPEARCLLYRNELAFGNWLQVELEGIYADKDGIGSRVEVYSDGKILIREIDGGSSHLSQGSTRAHFGLAAATQVDSVVVKWLGGKTQVIKDVEANQLISILEVIDVPALSSDPTLTVFPNAFSDSFYIDYAFPNAGRLEIILSDLGGRILVKLASIDNAAPRGFLSYNQASRLPIGTYVLTVKLADETESVKVVKR